MTFEQLLEEYFFARLLRPDTQSCYCTAWAQGGKSVYPLAQRPPRRSHTAYGTGVAPLPAKCALYQAGELESLYAPYASLV